MKAIKVLLAMVGLVLLSGCLGPYFGNQGEYYSGKWGGRANLHEAGQVDKQRLSAERERMALDLGREQNRLVLAKLEARSVITGIITPTGVVANASSPTGKTASAGYGGIIINKSQYRPYTFEVKGPEIRSFYLLPGQRAYEPDRVDRRDNYIYLTAGKYVGTLYYGGEKVGTHDFTVPTDNIFQGEKCDWELHADW